MTTQNHALASVLETKNQLHTMRNTQATDRGRCCSAFLRISNQRFISSHHHRRLPEYENPRHRARRLSVALVSVGFFTPCACSSLDISYRITDNECRSNRGQDVKQPQHNVQCYQYDPRNSKDGQYRHCRTPHVYHSRRGLFRLEYAAIHDDLKSTSVHSLGLAAQV